MKRQIEFKFENDRYLLKENGEEIFSIKTSDLKFNSIAFYNGVYKNKTPAIELVNSLNNDTFKKGTYIFKWLNEIITEINAAFPGLQNEDVDVASPQEKMIPLFDFSACAGDGFFIDNDISHSEIPDRSGQADYAVTISGDSMEPTITDGSVALVKQVEALENRDIGLFVVDGDVMCKRYVKVGRGFNLVPDNQKYQAVSSKHLENCTILGKVISLIKK